MRVDHFRKRFIIAVKTEHADKTADNQVPPMRIHHVLRMPENMLFLGKAHHLERRLHFFKRSIALLHRIRLIELHKPNKKLGLVLAQAQPRSHFRDARARKILVTVHHATDEIFGLEPDFIRENAERKGRVRLLLCAIIILQKLPVVQVFEDFFP